MKILIDATAVNEGGGGMVTYLRGLLRGWAEAGYRDEIAVIGTQRLPAEIDVLVPAPGRVYRVGGIHPGSRIVIQQAILPGFVLRLKPDVILATSPVVPMLVGWVPIVAMIHDFRYLSRPNEFGRMQRIYRTVMYRQGLKRARRLLANSRSTEAHARTVHSSVAAKITTAYLGADGIDWGEPAKRGTHAIAFGHWSNKRPEIAIRAWGIVRAAHAGFDATLHVVGVTPADLPRLSEIAHRSQVLDLVDLHGYLAESEFRRIFASARLVMIPSTLEGFGLPVVEAMLNRVAVVASSQSAMQEAGGRFALFASGDAPEAYARLCEQVIFDDPFRERLIDDAYEHAQQFTWRKTATLTRGVLQSAVAVATTPAGIPRSSRLGQDQ